MSEGCQSCIKLKDELVAAEGHRDSLRSMSTCTKCGWHGVPSVSVIRSSGTHVYTCMKCKYAVPQPLIAVERENEKLKERIKVLSEVIGKFISGIDEWYVHGGGAFDDVIDTREWAEKVLQEVKRERTAG